MSQYDEFVEYRDDTEVVAHRISQCYKLKLIKCNLDAGPKIFKWQERRRYRTYEGLANSSQIKLIKEVPAA